MPLLPLLSLAALAAPDRPNILFSMADQLRFDALSAVTPSLHTPNLDSLAAEGVRFARAYSSTPTCIPARAALLTGRSPWNHGMLGMTAMPTRYPFEFPRALAAAGYATATVGKDHFGWNRSEGVAGGVPFSHHYNSLQVYDGATGYNADQYHDWFRERVGNASALPSTSCWPSLDYNSWRGAPFGCDESLHPMVWVGTRAVEYLRANVGAGLNGAPPFLLKVSFHRPHSPYDPPARLLNATSADDVPPPARAADGWSDGYAQCAAQCVHGHECCCADAWCGKMADGEEVYARRAYHASVSLVDEQMGRIRSVLEETGLLERTVWIFTSDHGDGQGDHYHWRKGFGYEFSTHVPMLLRWPRTPGLLPVKIGVVPGAVLTPLVEMRDVAPTLLHAAGALPTDAARLMDGSSVLCLLKSASGPHGASASGATEGRLASDGCPPAWRSTLGIEHNVAFNASVHWNGILHGKYKYIYHAYQGHEQLFDLEDDPKETRDLSRDQGSAGTLASLRQMLIEQFETEGRGPEWVADGKLVPRPQGQMCSPNFPGGQDAPTCHPYR